MFAAQLITGKSICSKTCSCGREHHFCEVLGTNARQCLPWMVQCITVSQETVTGLAAAKCRPDTSCYSWCKSPGHMWPRTSVVAVVGQANCEHRWLRSAVRWVISSAPSAQVICSVDAALWRRVSIPFHCSGDLYELWVSLWLSTDLLFPSATYPVISSGSGWYRNPLTQGSARNTSPCTCPRE